MSIIRLVDLLKNPESNKEVQVNGWVRTFRANRFIALNDGSTIENLQCVVDFEKTEESLLKKIECQSLRVPYSRRLPAIMTSHRNCCTSYI